MLLLATQDGKPESGQNHEDDMKPLIPNLSTFGDLVDRLIVELLKLSYFEQSKRDEHGKENPDPEMITKWDNMSRDACEYRSLLKDSINAMLTQIVENKEYRTLRELRTFSPPSKTVGDLLVELVEYRANPELKKELVAALEAKLKGLDK